MGIREAMGGKAAVAEGVIGGVLVWRYRQAAIKLQRAGAHTRW
jgi:hypothetical protein